MLLDKAAFDAWKSDPVTKAIFALLEKKRELLRRQWESGTFTDYERDATVLVNVGNMGTCKGYAFVADLTYEDYLLEVEDGEQKRTGPERGSSFN